MLWSKIQAGDTTENGQPSNLLLLAKGARDRGGLQTREQYDAFAKKIGPLLSDRSEGWKGRLRNAMDEFVPVPPEIEAIAAAWEKLGNQGMATAIRTGGRNNSNVSPEEVAFLKQRLAEAQAKVDPNAPKPQETFSLDAHMQQTPSWKKFQEVASPEARAYLPLVEQAAQGHVDQANQAGYPINRGSEAPPGHPAKIARQNQQSLLGTFARFVNKEVAVSAGYKNAKPEDLEDARRDLNKMLGLPEESQPGAPETETPAAPAPAKPPPEAEKPPPEQPRAEEAPQPEPPPDVSDGSDNKFFKQDRYEAAKARMKDRYNRLSSGFDPLFALDGLEIAGYHIERGFRKFAHFAKAMIEDLGDKVIPHLDQFYTAVRKQHGFDTAGMDDEATVAAELKRMAEAPAKPAQEPEEHAPPGQRDLNEQIAEWKRDHGPDGAMARVVAQALEDRARGDNTDPIKATDLQQIADIVYEGKLSEGAYSRDRMYDAIELGVNRFIQANPQKFNPTTDAEGAKHAAQQLAEIKSKLPTQTVRSGEKDTHQQFSTPPDYAYAATWVANIKPGEEVLEPSAGTGGLAVHAMNAGANVSVNVLSDKRRGMIADLKPARVTGENASQLHNILPPEIAPTTVIMNPPFSAAPGRMENRMVLGEGARHVEQALARLQPGGRLIAIVGRGMTMEAPAFKEWWERIGAQYDVRANLGVGGKIYQKYGTSFGTRLLVIDKRPPSGQEPIKGEVQSADEIIERLKGIRDDRGAVQPVATQSTGAPLAPTDTGAGGPTGQLPSPTGVVGTGKPVDSAVANQPQPTGTTQPGVSGGQPTGVQPPAGGVRNPVVSVKPESQPSGTAGQPVATATGGTQPGGGGGGGAGDGIRPDGSGERDQPGVTEAPETVAATEAAVTNPENQQITESIYEPYRPQRV